MNLPLKLEKKFEMEIKQFSSKPRKVDYSAEFRGIEPMFEDLIRNAFGTTLKEKDEKVETEKQNYILRLFQIGKHTPDEIALLLELDISYIHQVLTEKGLI